MDTALPQKFPFSSNRNLAKANCTGNRVWASCDKVVLGYTPQPKKKKNYEKRNSWLKGLDYNIWCYQ